MKSLGLKRGKIRITMKRFQYRAGDTIQGVVSYKLSAPTRARALRVGLCASQRIIGRRIHSGASSGVRVWKQPVFDFWRELSGPAEYREGHHPFEIMIPSSLVDHNPSPPGVLGDLVQALAYLGPLARFPVHWWVRATLDVPWRPNLSAKEAVTVDWSASQATR